MSEIEDSIREAQAALHDLRDSVAELEARLARGELPARVGLAGASARVEDALARVGRADADAAADAGVHWVRVADRFDRTLDVYGPLPLAEAQRLRERHAGPGRRVQVLEADAAASARVRAWWTELAERRSRDPRRAGLA